MAKAQDWDQLFCIPEEEPVQGKLALITGCSAGIGKATACLFAKKGINLVLVARRAEKLQEMKDEIDRRELGVEVTCVPGDGKDDLVYEKLRELGLIDKIDFLIANAGCALGKDPVGKAVLSDWKEMLDANAFGTFRMIQEILPGMIARGTGTIIATGSIAGLEPYEGGSVYCASKYAAHAFMKSLRYETYDKGIRVCVMAPGFVGEGTEFAAVRFKGNEDAVKATYSGMKELRATDLASQMLWVVKQPKHVNLDLVHVMPTCQGGATRIFRGN